MHLKVQYITVTSLCIPTGLAVKVYVQFSELLPDIDLEMTLQVCLVVCQVVSGYQDIECFLELPCEAFQSSFLCS